MLWIFWWNFYRLQRSCGKVMFSQASVILLTGGVYPNIHWDRHPLGRHSPPLGIPDTSPSRHPPGRHPGWTKTSLWADTPPPRRSLQRTARILLEMHSCIFEKSRTEELCFATSFSFCYFSSFFNPHKSFSSSLKKHVKMKTIPSIQIIEFSNFAN